MRIPLSAPDITEPEIEAVSAVLRTPHLSLGPKLDEFEAAVAAFTQVPHAIAVSSGTAGLHLAVRALNIGEGDEVIVPSFTFIAAANAIRYERATPVFADIDRDSLNLCPDAVARAITPRTRALLVVHTFGRPADMNPLLALARRHNLAIIEDACEAIGAAYDGRPAGSFGDVAVFAFYPNKQITTGEGGMVVTRDSRLAATIRSLRNQGRRSSESDAWLQHTDLGFNYRLSDIACTLGIGQLARLREILARREHIARLYHQQLAAEPGLILPALELPDLPNARTSWFVYVVRLQPHFTEADRDAVVQHLHDAGIACGRYFAPIHLQRAYTEYRHAAHLPITESEAARTLALPFFNRLTESQIAEVANTLKAAIARRP
ncbi:MAG TPA: DegT/DnrJ/EryC1/StrS family aminotransferase [Granulicella sp.]|jgi:perosamine synthetase|nr:DegT/DnrJ/EryC1/StrS family aminotransferase [Granulicella sp.]